jgi:hypothetical protein
VVSGLDDGMCLLGLELRDCALEAVLRAEWLVMDSGFMPPCGRLWHALQQQMLQTLQIAMLLALCVVEQKQSR